MEKRDKPAVDPELKRRIDDLIAYKGGGHNSDLIEDVVENALKLLHDVQDRGDVRVIQTALRELRYAFKLFAPYAATRKVTIFGSARTLPNKTEYKQAVEFARKISAASFMIITGAGPGKQATKARGRRKVSAPISVFRGNRRPILSFNTIKN